MTRRQSILQSIRIGAVLDRGRQERNVTVAERFEVREIAERRVERLHKYELIPEQSRVDRPAPGRRRG